MDHQADSRISLMVPDTAHCHQCGFSYHAQRYTSREGLDDPVQ